MRRATGDEPWIDRSMVGFGTCHQRYPSDLGVLGAVVRSSYGRSPPTCREPGEGR
jgi:hypothetical protein